MAEYVALWRGKTPVAFWFLLKILSHCHNYRCILPAIDPGELAAFTGMCDDFCTRSPGFGLAKPIF